MRLSRRHLLSGLSALALAPAVAACGTSGGDPTGAAVGTGSGTGSGTAAGVEENAFPATITHKYGRTTVSEAPSRVVVVGLLEQDTLLALGVVPVGVTKWFGDAEGAIFPWAVDALGDAALPTVLAGSDGIDVEKVAALAPDLIVGCWSGMTQNEYDLLSKLAPVVAQSGEHVDYGMPWEEIATTVGTAVGRPAAAARLVDDVTATIDSAAAAHPEFAGRTAVVVAPYEGLFVYGPEDVRNRMLTSLGFEFPTAVLGTDADQFGVSLSAERTADLGSLDVVVWLGLTNDKTVQAVFDKTTAAARGRYFDIPTDDSTYAVAQSMVTPLSIPYTLERYVPQLAAAVDGDPSTDPPTVTG